ncbi:hypothetical protein [Mangrovitalea sediminis]|uniref:hypothetical protein n=1 Tax=Mangrovitalea sediminis TaxID=1982043 RepID=UPI000BE509C3|nr:hypothetical protein [Mangrovitalea sediminis]
MSSGVGRGDSSVLMRRFLAALDAVSCVSFDVFDTLIFRRYASPRALFVDVGQQAIQIGLLPGMEPALYADYRIAAENKARSLSQQADVSLDVILSYLPWSGEVLSTLKEIEVRLELEAACICPLARQMVELAFTAGKQVVFVSDMYLPPSVIRQMLSPVASTANSLLFVSSDFNATKATGALFRLILDELSLVPSELLHVGDHEQGDYRAPKRLGCQALRFYPSDYARQLLELESRYVGGDGDWAAPLRYQAALLNPYDHDLEAFFFDFGGLVWGPVMHAFATWVYDLAEALRLDRILFAMREGALFEACCRQVWADKSSSLPLANIFISRRATFAAGLDLTRLATDVGRVMERTYASAEDVCEDLGLASEVASGELVPWLQEHEYMVEQAVVLARQRLQRYFAQLTGEGERVGVFDFGGGGSILRNLARGLGAGKTQITPLLFFLHPRALKSIDELGFLAFLSGGNRVRDAVNTLARNPEIFEILLTGTSGSTLGYSDLPDGRVEPVLDQPVTDERLRSACSAFEKGIQAYLETVCDRREMPLQRTVIASLLARVIDVPLPAEAAWLGDLTHADNLGLRSNGKICSDSAERLIAEMDVGVFWQQYNENPSLFFDRCKWPQGSITRMAPNWLRTVRGLNGESDEARAISQILARLASEGVRRCAVYGAGLFFEALFPELRRLGVEVTHLIDRKAEAGTFRVGGVTVIPLSKAFDEGVTRFVIASVAFAEQIEEVIMLQAAERGILASVSIYSARF